MTNTELLLAIAIAAVIVALIFVFVQLSDLDQRRKYLDDRIDECATRWKLEHTDREAKDMRQHIDAIEQHLGVVLIKESARLVVVKTKEPS